MDGQRSVLIIDPSEETREVLQTVLERRGWRTFATGRAGTGLEMARRHHPDLVVLDVEVLGEPDRQAAGDRVAAAPEPGWPTTLVLGSVRRAGRAVPGGQFVAKPYHYGTLVRRIEELLATAPQAAARSA